MTKVALASNIMFLYLDSMIKSSIGDSMIKSSIRDLMIKSGIRVLQKDKGKQRKRKE